MDVHHGPIVKLDSGLLISVVNTLTASLPPNIFFCASTFVYLALGKGISQITANMKGINLTSQTVG